MVLADYALPIVVNRPSEPQLPLPNDRIETVERIQSVLKDVGSALFLPLWDFERNRWFAGCFCWSQRIQRHLSSGFELPFTRIFGYMVMQEVARLDAVETSQVKATFLASLSHELRSPLHGILGSIQLVRSTPLDSFQSAMVNQITVCGRTLLETVQHLLDHAERKESASTNRSSKSFPKENTIRITSDLQVSPVLLGSSRATPFCNIGLVTEEVVETMFLGQTRFDVSLGGEDTTGKSYDPMSDATIPMRRSRFIIIDIADYVSNVNLKTWLTHASLIEDSGF